MSGTVGEQERARAVCVHVCVRERMLCVFVSDGTYAEDNLEEQASERGLGLYV